VTITALEVPASGWKTTATARAVTYLRVSTKEQAQKGGRNEGYSIPAQRRKAQRPIRHVPFLPPPPEGRLRSNSRQWTVPSAGP
jgi:hypothetical protein